ncbi:hypothetical protein AN963_16615 [Brevibacillus choshinensis]|uniref:Uncharacterized protein n=1 Tax=Brevibacillus choshinensis TaxID=54911 RepID=A0ABR5N7F3_BRECH|nr:hypothetical protein [Brevibacillus choshinensis]KQL46546.1 hypothetical protein AN963_16615 [Brevibacillus choshinensis]
MKRKSLQKSLSVSLLAVLAIQPFVSVVHADLNIKGNTTSTGGIQVKTPATIQVIGSPTVEGTITVTGALTIVPKPENIHSTFQHASYLLKPTAANPVIDFGGVTTGLVTIGNTNVGTILRADGISRIEYAKNVTPGNAELRGTQLDAARTGLTNAVVQVDVATASASQTAFVSAKGNPDHPVYKDVTTGLVTLQNAKTAAETTLANKIAVLSDLTSATTVLSNAQDALDAKVDLLDVETKRLKDEAAALAQALTLLNDTITGLDLSSANAALTAYTNVQGDVEKAVYKDVAKAISDLEAARTSGQAVYAKSDATLQEVVAATTAITDGKALLADKQTLLVAATQQLVNELIQAKADLSSAMASFNKTEVDNAKASYLTAGGLVSDVVYNNLVVALAVLDSAETEANGFLASSSSTLVQLKGARDKVLSAQTEVTLKTNDVKTATQALKEWNQAKTALTDAISSVNTTAAVNAQSDYKGANGKDTAQVYADVTEAINALNDAKSSGETLIGKASATKEEFLNAKDAITAAQGVLNEKVDKLKVVTQELKDLAQARASLSAEITAAEPQLAGAATSLTNYEAALGDKAAVVYTDAVAAKQDLNAKVDAGKLAHDEPASTVADLNAAKSAITNAKTVLSTKLTALDSATEALVIERNNAKQALAKAIADVDVTKAQQAQSAYVDKGGNLTLAVYKDVTAAITAVQQAKTAGQAINPTSDPVSSIKDATTAITNAQVDINGKVTALKSATDSLVMPTLTSKELDKFNFSTVYSGQINAVSKAMNTSSFKGSKKHFTIDDGKNKVNIDLTWDIPQNEYATTFAASIGSAVESEIQQHFLDTGGVNGLMNRTMGATVIWDGSNQGNTFKIFTFGQPGIEKLTLYGTDWQYFFDTNTFDAPNQDKSANREFTISDGTKTATFKWDSDLVDMAGVLKALNDNLSANGVKVVAVQVNASTFQLVGTRADITISVGGTNKGDLFP